MTEPLSHRRTKVCVIGAGASGLVLSQLLHLEGIESIVLERSTRPHVEKRVRAGLMEEATVEVLREAEAAERLNREALVHHGFEFRFGEETYRMPFTELTGASVWMYGQQEVVKDLLAIRVDQQGADVHFGVDDVHVERIGTDGAVVRCTINGRVTEIECDFLIGCDGFHGVCRRAVPAAEMVAHDRTYPFAWLGVLAAARPLSPDELIYAISDRGFALQSMRSPSVSRQYLQVPPGEGADDRSDEEIWAELDHRLVGGVGTLPTGQVLERTLVALRSFVAETVQHRRMFLVGDAAHIVPPSAAKGLNLAVADAKLLAEALTLWYRNSRREALDAYPETMLRRAWMGQEFSQWMTSLLHVSPDELDYDHRIRRAKFDHLTRSTVAATYFAEQYVGLSRR